MNNDSIMYVNEMTMKRDKIIIVRYINGLIKKINAYEQKKEWMTNGKSLLECKNSKKSKNKKKEKKTKQKIYY